jgi:hypothetical protein
MCCYELKEIIRNIMNMNLAGATVYCKPFPHFVLDNALPSETAERIQDEIMELSDDEFDESDTQFESYFYLRRKSELPHRCEDLHHYLNSQEILDHISEMVGIRVYPDKSRRWTSIEKWCNGDHAAIHTDTGKHPETGQKKEVVLILCLGEDWCEDYGGSLEIWDGQSIKCVRKIAHTFNRVVIIQCTDNSWHGIPDPVECKFNAHQLFYTVSYLSDLSDKKDDLNK